MFIVHQKKHLNKILDMLLVVNKETQPLLLTFNRFHIGSLLLALSKYDKVDKVF